MIDLKEILGRAILLIESRSGDVDIDDEDFATTGTDQIIHLEQAIADAFNTNGDDATMIECWDQVEAYCDEITRLKERVEELKRENEWVSVEDRLPEEDQIVLLCNVERFMNCHFDLNWYGAGYLNSFNSWYVIGEGRGLCLDAVTHWKPIKPPTEEG
jgi:hypothetical protein